MVLDNAQLDKVSLIREGIPGDDIVAQRRHPRFQIFGKKAPENHLAVEHHMNIVDPDGQMAQHVIKQRFVCGIMMLQPAEKLIQRDAKTLRDALRRDIGLKAALPPAGAAKSAGFDADMAEFSALCAVAGIKHSA